MNVVVTGATKGIGKAVATAFLDGACHLVFCARKEEEVIALQQRWQRTYPKAKVKGVAADLSTENGVAQFALEIKNIFSSIDILVNNAGQFIPGEVCTEPQGLMEKMMAVNFYSAYYLTRALLPSILPNAKGHIFNICSIASLKAYENGGSYSISKYALKGFTENLREELKSKGIKVTGIYPGATYTFSWEASDISAERIMEASDIATMVYAAAQLSPQAVVEDIVIRPQLGDL